MGSYSQLGQVVDTSYKSLTRPPATHFITANVPAPTELYCTDDTFLRLILFGSIGAVQLVISYKLLRSDDGVETTFQQSLSYPSAGSTLTFDFDMIEGFMMGVSLITPSTVLRGQLFAVAQLMRGSVIDPKVQRVLFTDYVVGQQPIGFPGGPVRQSVDGRGSMLGSAQPGGVGTELAMGTSAPQQRMQIQSISVTFVTSAAVANRVPEFRLLRGGTVVWRMPYPGTIPASTTVGITLMTGTSAPVIVGTVAVLPLPIPCVVTPNDVITTVTAALQAGDQYTVANVGGEVWVNG